MSLCTSIVSAQDTTQVQSVVLDDVTIKASKRTLRVRNDSDGSTVWNMNMMHDLPRIMGNANPLHYVQMLPSVRTNNEYSSGIHIQGSENGHNEISIEGVPLYNVNHLMGFFSTFNASHYETMSLNKSAMDGSFPNRLGGQLTMWHNVDVSDSISGQVEVGLVSSQGTVRIPTSSSSKLTISARSSYINTLYGKWMKTDDLGVNYSFYDLNATWLKTISPNHTIIVDAYKGADKATMQDVNYLATVRSKWGNAMGSVHWKYNNLDGIDMHTMLFGTTYTNTFGLTFDIKDGALKSHITDYGVRTNLRLRQWAWGLDIVYHNIQPQKLEGYETNGVGENTYGVWEGSVYGGYDWLLTNYGNLNLACRISVLSTSGKLYKSVDPSLKWSYYIGNVKCSVSYAWRHQYMFQSNFTDVGIPTEFWFSADKNRIPQYAHGIQTQIEGYFLAGHYQWSLDVYYKHVYNQLEYDGTMFDIINNHYNFNNNLLHGDGKNYGVSLMLSKCTGKLTGWVSYAYSKANRTFIVDGLKRTYPANHDRTHELNAVATYKLSSRWCLGATMVACSGTPFTAPECAYILNGNVMSQMGEHNANRLKTYLRLDLSANYEWKRNMGVNISLYNAICHANDLFHYVRVSKRNDIYYKAVEFVAPILPSVSFFYRF